MAAGTSVEEIPTIIFTNTEARKIGQPHDDALVVIMMVGNNNVHRILIDRGSSVDVMCISTFKKIGLTTNLLKPLPIPLYGFAREKVILEGSIKLPISIRQTEYRKALMVRFLVVDIPSFYNIILSKLSLNSLRAVVSTYHLLMKFSVTRGLGEIREDQYEARRCLAIALRENNPSSEKV